MPFAVYKFTLHRRSRSRHRFHHWHWNRVLIADDLPTSSRWSPVSGPSQLRSSWINLARVDGSFYNANTTSTRWSRWGRWLQHPSQVRAHWFDPCSPRRSNSASQSQHSIIQLLWLDRPPCVCVCARSLLKLRRYHYNQWRGWLVAF